MGSTLLLRFKSYQRSVDPNTQLERFSRGHPVLRIGDPAAGVNLNRPCFDAWSKGPLPPQALGAWRAARVIGIAGVSLPLQFAVGRRSKPLKHSGARVADTHRLKV